MIYRSGNFSLDTQSFEFMRDGEPVAIEPQVFDLLVYLMDNRERVVGRDELLEQLWKGRIVTDNALNGRLKIARKAIGDDGRRQHFIKTVPRRGYQFVSEVEIDSANGDASFETRPQSNFESERPSIAVLPFEFQGSDPGREYLADGLAQAIIGNLCCYRELLVISRESILTLRAGEFDLEDLVAELCVEYLVSGTVRQVDSRIRLSTKMQSAADFETIWADHFDHAHDNLFEFEDEVSSTIVSILVQHIENQAHRRALRKRPENMTAYDCVLRAKRDVDSWDPVLTSEARSHLERALTIDQNYAPAHAYLAWTYCIEAESSWGMDRHAAIAMAIDYAERSVQLDEFDSDAQIALGYVYALQSKFELAEDVLDRAIECNRNAYGAYCMRGWVLAASGRPAEAVQCEMTALRLNPLAPDGCLETVVVAKYLEGNYDEALQWLSRAKLNLVNTEALRAACLAQLGRHEEANEVAASVIARDGEYVRHGEWILGWTFRNPNDFEHLLDGFVKSGLLIEKPQPVKSNGAQISALG